MPSGPRRTMLATACMLVATATSCGLITHHVSFGRGMLFLGTNRVPLRVEIAVTREAQERGLMDRTGLAPDAGMVFVFPSPVETAFWMKDTLIPLSIAFVDQSSQIIAIYDMEPCQADPCPAYGPGTPYVQAVEANRGFFRDHGIDVGDRVELER